MVQYGDETAVNTAVSLDDCTTNWNFIRIVQGLVRPTLTRSARMGEINRDLVLYLRAALSATVVAKSPRPHSCGGETRELQFGEIVSLISSFLVLALPCRLPAPPRLL